MIISQQKKNGNLLEENPQCTDPEIYVDESRPPNKTHPQESMV